MHSRTTNVHTVHRVNTEKIYKKTHVLYVKKAVQQQQKRISSCGSKATGCRSTSIDNVHRVVAVYGVHCVQHSYGSV